MKPQIRPPDHNYDFLFLLAADTGKRTFNENGIDLLMAFEREIEAENGE